MGLTVSEAIFKVLKEYVDTVFFLPGGGAMYLVDALGKSGLKYVTALHEQGAGYMACGYAMQRGGLGVCLVTSGPGATNAITPCAAAWMDSIPVLFISGQVRTENMIGDSGLRSKGGQEIDIIPMIKPITKYALRPIFVNHMVGGDIRDDIYDLAEICLEGRRGPCWIDIPLDIQNGSLEDA